MKKFAWFVLFSVALFGYELDDDILSLEQNELFDAQFQKSLKEKDFNQLSWVSPINISLGRSWSKNYATGKYGRQDTFSVGIDQPIFRFGGIYYGIKMYGAKYNLSKLELQKRKKELIATAVELLFKIKQTKLTIKKLKLQLKNADIETKSVQELFNAGLSDSIALDSAMVKKTQAKIALLDMKSGLSQLYAAFAKISSKNPDTLRVPKLRMVGKEQFLEKSFETKIASANSEVATNALSVTKAKYYPSIVAGAHYSKILSKVAPNVPKKRLNYSLSISVPLSVNMGNDIEIAKYNKIIASLNKKISQKNAKVDYNLVSKRVGIFNQKIHFAKSEANLYRKLLKSTKNLYRAGQKSIWDVQMLKNSMRIKEIDAKIFSIEKEIELLKLYKGMQ